MCALHTFGVVALTLFLGGLCQGVVASCICVRFMFFCGGVLSVCVLRTLSSSRSGSSLSQAHPGAVLAAARSIASANAE